MSEQGLDDRAETRAAGATHVFSLGLLPVQDFIAQAKRSRDLKAGSALLSAWMTRLLGRLQGAELGTDVVLPKTDGEFKDPSPKTPLTAYLADTYSLPNRASGFLTLPSEIGQLEATERIREVFGGLEELQVRKPWERLRQEAADHLLRRLREAAVKDPTAQGLGDELRASYRRYLDRLEPGAQEGTEDCPTHLLWCVLPLDRDAGARPPLEVVDEAFQAVKRNRPIAPWTGGPAGKCNQCGAREAFGPMESFAAWHQWHERLRRALEGSAKLQSRTQLDPGERLCWVCYARRRAGYSAPRQGGGAVAFKSTGEVAGGPWLRRAREIPKIRRILEKIEATALGKEDFGRALLMPEAALRRLSQVPDSGAGEVLDLRRSLQGQIRRHPELPARPTPFLALLSFDGDGMGRKVRRDPVEVPQQMNQFTGRAAKLLAKEACGPATFYLGGDEGLVMAPAAHALDLAQALHQAFEESFPGQATLSAGIAFFEYSRPLRGAIRAAHAALARAKARPRKDALAVAVETASGKAFSARVVSWPEAEGLLGRLAGWMATDQLSNGWVQDAAAFVETHRATLPEQIDESPREVRDAALEEVRRIFHRRWQSPLQAEKKFQSAEQAWRGLKDQAGWQEAGLPDPALLRLTAFLARHGEPSTGDGREQQEGDSP